MVVNKLGSGCLVLLIGSLSTRRSTSAQGNGLLSPHHGHWHLIWVTSRTQACGGRSFPDPMDQLYYPIDVFSSPNRAVIVTVAFSLHFNFLLLFFPFQRAKAQSLVHSLSLIMVDASLGTIQCLEEIVSICLDFGLCLFC